MEKDADSLVLMVGGVGLKVRVPAGTLDRAPAPGEEMGLHTWFHLRQDIPELFGFDSKRAKDLFVKLMSVSGFGSSRALSVLSIFSPEGFDEIIKRGDLDALRMIPGVGKKSAERLLLEMKDKVEAESVEIAGLPEERRAAFQEAAEALVQLGYSRNEAYQALKGFPIEDREAGVEQMLQFALKEMARPSAGGMK